MSSQHQQFSQSEPVLLNYQIMKLPSRPSTAENRREINQKSSPVQVVGSQESLRQEYMTWQIGRNPREQSIIQSAFKKIEKDMYSLRDLCKLTKSD